MLEQVAAIGPNGISEQGSQVVTSAMLRDEIFEDVARQFAQSAMSQRALMAVEKALVTESTLVASELSPEEDKIATELMFAGSQASASSAGVATGRKSTPHVRGERECAGDR